jgi:hypothetical protein
VRRRYAEQALRRTLYLDFLLHGAVGGHPNMSVVGKPGSLYELRSRASSGPDREYKVVATTRQPTLDDARFLAEHPSHGQPVIFGPHDMQSEDRVRTTRWLATKIGGALAVEGRVLSMAKEMAAGNRLL